MNLIKRRQAVAQLLVASIGTFFSFVACSHLKPRDRKRMLEQDLAQLSTRKYSEQGIPVFLVCEDLASSASTKRLSDESIKLATALDEAADLFAQNQSPKDDDLPKLIELLAARDFGTPLQSPSRSEGHQKSS